MFSDMKDLSRRFNISMSEVLEMTPFEFKLLKLMIKNDLEKEAEAMK